MKSKYTLLILLIAATSCAFAQYSGGAGSGYSKAEANGKHLTNFFQTDGNWSTNGNWRDSQLPASTEEANVAAHATLDNNYSYPAVNILSGASLTVAGSTNLTVTETLTNSAGSPGLVIESGGSLLHNTNDVQATIKRAVTGAPIPAEPGVSTKYHLVSIPLATSVNSLSSQFTGAYLYEYAPSTNSWAALGEQTNTPLSETLGYMVYYTSNQTITFAGPINNGSFSPSLTYAGLGGGYNFSLIPNPYPSAIDWHAFAPADKTNVGNTIWIFNNGNYATYTWDGENSSSTNSGSRYIAVGQAFFVQTTGNSPALNMSNAVRTHTTSPFLKNTNTPDKQLRMSAQANGLNDEALITFRQNASDEYLSSEDALKFYGSSGAPQLYSLAGSQKLSVNNMHQPKGTTDVPLAFECDLAGDYSLSFSQLETFPESVSLYLTDHLSETTHNLRENAVYQFSHQPGNAAGRFSITFGGSIGVEENLLPRTKILSENNRITIMLPTSEQTAVKVYNTTGQLVHQTAFTGNQHSISMAQPGIYLVQVSSGTNIFTGKVHTGR